MIPPSSKVALVHDWITVPGGAEEVLREALDLFPGVVHTGQYNPARFPWLRETEVRDTWVSRLPFSKTRHYIYAPLLPGAYSAMDLSGFDLVLADSHSFAHHARAAKGALHICYYHTPARSLWAPEVDDRAGQSPLHKLVANRLRRLDLVASKNPHVLFANSQTTAERMRRAYGRDANQVIYPPVDTRKWSDVTRVSDEEGFLAWGRLIRYKRFDLAIDAAKLGGFRLNIVGAGPLDDSLKQRAGGAKNVVFHGRLPDDQLKDLMSRSSAVVFPCYEDFGIVPVEAMAAGLPVVAYGAGGASETVTASCGALFLEQTPQALAAAMKQVLSESYDDARLRSRAAEFDKSVFRDTYSRAVREAWERHADRK